MSEPRARVIADSISPAGHRLTTFEVVMHRFVLAEFNTHRVFSRNSASSRAIPLRKQLDRVVDDPAWPVKWPAEQPGMQGGDEVSPEQRGLAETAWSNARKYAVNEAVYLGEAGVHKSIANRLLEPFMWHTVVVTATAWGNFFGLRCNPMAQPEIRVAAEAMHDAYMKSIPTQIEYAEWHLPYIDDEDVEAAREYLRADGLPSAGHYTERDLRRTLVQMSSARCARVSYLTQDGKRSPLDDISLYNRLTLADPMHASPLEHVATPRVDNVQGVNVYPSFTTTGSEEPLHLVLPRYGNLLGWHAHRFDVEATRQYQAFA